MGDVPMVRGVCSDVVIRAFRTLGVDLQQELHRDMKRHFAAYPKNWGLAKPDRNIDHRRVPNLATWFKRQGYDLSVSQDAAAYSQATSSPGSWAAGSHISASCPTGARRTARGRW